MITRMPRLFVHWVAWTVLLLTIAAPSNAFVIPGGRQHPTRPSSFSNQLDCLQLQHRTTTTTLWREKGGKQVQGDGTSVRGPLLLALSLFICVWFFTIPPEFRRARLCDEAETAAYPDKCMTFQNKCPKALHNITDKGVVFNGIFRSIRALKSTLTITVGRCRRPPSSDAAGVQ